MFKPKKEDPKMKKMIPGVGPEETPKMPKAPKAPKMPGMGKEKMPKMPKNPKQASMGHNGKAMGGFGKMGDAAKKMKAPKKKKGY